MVMMMVVMMVVVIFTFMLLFPTTAGYKSVRHVLRSVPINAQQIFKLLASQQMQKRKEAKHTKGIKKDNILLFLIKN